MIAGSVLPWGHGVTPTVGDPEHLLEGFFQGDFSAATRKKECSVNIEDQQHLCRHGADFTTAGRRENMIYYPLNKGAIR